MRTLEKPPDGTADFGRYFKERETVAAIPKGDLTSFESNFLNFQLPNLLRKLDTLRREVYDNPAINSKKYERYKNVWLTKNFLSGISGTFGDEELRLYDKAVSLEENYELAVADFERDCESWAAVFRRDLDSLNGHSGTKSISRRIKQVYELLIRIESNPAPDMLRDLDKNLHAVFDRKKYKETAIDARSQAEKARRSEEV